MYVTVLLKENISEFSIFQLLADFETWSLNEFNQDNYSLVVFGNYKKNPEQYLTSFEFSATNISKLQYIYPNVGK